MSVRNKAGILELVGGGGGFFKDQLSQFQLGKTEA